jgi:hypothetical protein
MKGFRAISEPPAPMDSLANSSRVSSPDKGSPSDDPNHNTTPVLEALDPLGEPLSITGVARLVGCSVWTIRQRFLPMGLPHFRIGPGGRITFFRNQVIAWVLAHQQRQHERRIGYR